MCGDPPGGYYGVFGVCGHANTAAAIPRGLFVLQHRERDGAGVITSDDTRLKGVEGFGLGGEGLDGYSQGGARGYVSVRHVRDSTHESSRLVNVRTLVAERADDMWTSAYPENLVTAARLRHASQESYTIFHAAADSLDSRRVEGLLVPFKAEPHFCRTCFTSEYPMDVKGTSGKRSLGAVAQALQGEKE